MANKNFTLDDGLTVTVYKRRGNRNLRLTVGSAGQVRVSIPAWAPYRAGLDFARSKQSWLRQQQPQPSLLKPGQPVGKAHHLDFTVGSGLSKPIGRVKASSVTVTYPPDTDFLAADVQAAAYEACIRALRSQAESLLPQRLAALADKHDFEYGNISVKRLKSRWGSCDQHRNIVLNLFLMQLPWDLIDYVLLHELVHTRVLRHGPEFWQAIEKVLPGAKARRRKLRDYRPALHHLI